ncbi:hypothetical protein [Brevundimonas sp. SORGH_AS_0993]|uniref:hypothetical protein n=1 Tax=Brevundimonas sp. SORGH_AS_0993 TaxID=3041794 RepID=UPI0027886923|nr:hypothetical protein [Brevundimonas sp. SORGH_AS_0993]MDQ1153170.1 hypothetical protein [Brevundimonas sp. SORGH_AS_0993]
MLSLLLAPLVALSGLPVTPYPSDMQKAELCRAHVMLLIADAYKEAGRVAGPSWFIRDWWSDRLTDEQLKTERTQAVEAAVSRRRTEAPARFDEERTACIQEAIQAGAVPGMTP